MKKNKSICSLSKSDIEKDFKEICEIVKDPKYICLKCGRAANQKSNLCKPEKMK